MSNAIEQRTIFVNFDDALLKRFRRGSLVFGALLIIAGIAGIAVPQVMSFVVSVFLGWLLLVAGVLSGYLVFLSRGRSMIAWLKPVLLVLTGGLFLFYPGTGVVTLALLLTFYLLLDAFGSFGLAHDLYPARGWGWMLLNGAVSLALALVLLFAWPAASPVIVGLYIGISLFFDGLALVFLGLLARR